jgi:hypothetical protein
LHSLHGLIGLTQGQIGPGEKLVHKVKGLIDPSLDRKDKGITGF